MSDLQHQRIVELCQELRLSAMPNVYSGISQSAAAKDTSFADFYIYGRLGAACSIVIPGPI